MTLVKNLDQRRKALGVVLTVGLGSAFLAGQGGASAAADHQASAHTALVANAEQVRVVAGEAASRSLPARAVIAAEAPAVQAPPKPADLPAPAAAPEPEKPKEVAPVAGLDQTQMNNAKKIVETAKGMGLGKRAQVIAVATAMQESNLYNLGNPGYEVSLGMADGGRVGFDHDSVGLFQQRPVSGWGTPENIMKPEYATRSFLSRLVDIAGWEGMALTDAAQAVQVSAYPYAYAKHEGRATEVVDAFNR
jgi:hypothetical protein